MDALYSRAKQRKAKIATKPTQDNIILITPLGRQKESQMLVEGCPAGLVLIAQCHLVTMLGFLDLKVTLTSYIIVLK